MNNTAEHYLNELERLCHEELSPIPFHEALNYITELKELERLRAKGTQERDICKKCGGLGYVMDETTSIDCDNCGGVGRLPEFLILPQPTKVTTETDSKRMQDLKERFRSACSRTWDQEHTDKLLNEYASLLNSLNKQ